MNNKEFVRNLSDKLDTDSKEIQSLVESLIEVIADSLDEGDTLAVQGFGNFEVKKKMERVVVNPSSKQRMLVPPKLTFNFKPSNTLKEKIK